MSLYPNPPLYDNRSSETDSLIPRRVSHRSPSLNRWIWAGTVVLLTATITSVIFALVFPLSSCHDPLDPDVRDHVRKEWDHERYLYQEEVLKRIEIEKRWRFEDDERVRIGEQWMRETEEHERNVSEALRREIQEKQARRLQWMRETEEHERNVSEALRREIQEKQARRLQWEKEEEEHDREVKEWRAQWERELQERRKREEEERLRLNMFWTDPEPHTCTTYGTREYTARLVNVPSYYNRRVEACMATPIQIHGVEYKPKWCEDHGSDNVIGHWEADQHEPDCASFWLWYKDIGCISPGSGQRRIEHYLENLPWGGDWKEFCATTPASFRGMHFTGAEFCFQKDFGTYGHWAVDDQSCD